MTIKEYQAAAMTTCMPSSENFAYMFLNLAGELGEFASKVAKAIRKGEAHIVNDNVVFSGYTVGQYADLQKEGGDIMWQLFGLFSVMGWDADQIAHQNLDKLASRKERKVIDGNGDNR